MSLYDENYLILSEEDQKTWESIKSQSRKLPIDRTVEKTKAIRHYEKLFPNNYLDYKDLDEEEKLQNLRKQYLIEVTNHDATESSIKNWIKENKAYFIIASILKTGYNFGHHETYIFPEFKLGNTYQVDYLIVGLKSGGYEFLLIEMEHPNKEITTKSGDLGTAFRKGLKQIEDWKLYIESSFSSIQETFRKYKHSHRDLPSEFIMLDTSRFHYAVVAGLRSNFTDFTYRKKRSYKAQQQIDLLHYENLFDSSEKVIGEYY